MSSLMRLGSKCISFNWIAKNSFVLKPSYTMGKFPPLVSYFCPITSHSYMDLRQTRSYYNSVIPKCQSPSSSASQEAENAAQNNEDLTKGVFQMNAMDVSDHDKMLTLIFTCNKCETRAARQFSRHAYTKGTVLIECPGCGKFHLISDHLGWFQEGKDVEEILARKGETVRKITNAADVTPEIQAFVDEAAKERARSLERRAEIRHKKATQQQSEDKFSNQGQNVTPKESL